MMAKISSLGKSKIGQAVQKQARSKIKEVSTSIHPAVGACMETMLGGVSRTRPKLGLPTHPCENSHKIRGYVDFTLTTGTLGNGFVCFNPAGGSDVVQIATSTSAWAGAVIPALNSGAAGVSGYSLSNLPYTNVGVVTGGTSFRVVGATCAIKSTTASLYEQGTIQMYASPTHTDLTGYGTANFSARLGCITHALKKGEDYSITAHPASRAECEYNVIGFPLLNSAAGSVAAILITGASAANPVSFLCRYTIDCEVTGTNVETNSTPNPIPPAGAMDHILSIVGKVKMAHAHLETVKPAQLVKMGQSAYKAVQTGKTSGLSGMLAGLLL